MINCKFFFIFENKISNIKVCMFFVKIVRVYLICASLFDSFFWWFQIIFKYISGQKNPKLKTNIGPG